MDLPNKSDQQPLSLETAKADKKVIKPLISGAQQVKRPATRRFFDFVFAESPKAISQKVGRDVVVPRIKAGFEEAVRSFLSGMLWGGGGSPISGLMQAQQMRGGGMNYAAISNPMNPMSVAAAAAPQKSSGNYQDILCASQQHAEIVLAGMVDLFNQYRVVTVADLYELANITPATSDNAYGWYSLDGARIVHERDGYRLTLPRPGII